MIENLYFSKMNRLVPLVLNKSTLYLDVKPYEIIEIYIFLKDDFIQLTEVGNLWVKGRKKLRAIHKGYMIVRTFDNISSADEEGKYIGIIGYSDEFKYHLIDIAFHNYSYSLNGELTMSFSFNEFNKSQIK